MNVSPLFIFILGVLMGFVLALYVLQSAKTDAPSTATASTLDELLRTQIAYQQSQNMLRNLQLEQARQESDLYRIESERSQQLASAHRLNNYDIRAALLAHQDRG
jgi:flagellar biosynthesis protein FliP